MPYDYSKLRGRIKEIYIDKGQQSGFAKDLGMSYVSLSYKLNNRNEFSQREIEKAVILLKINKEDIPLYFFTFKVQ